MAFRRSALVPLVAPLLNVSLSACTSGDSTAPTQLPELPDASERTESGAHLVGSPGGPSLPSSDASPSRPSPGSPLATRPTGEDASFDDSSAPPASPEASLPYDSLLGIGCTGASPAFAADIVPVIRGCAAGEICHGTQFDYTGLVNATTQRDRCTPARVIVTPRDLSGSYVLNKLLGIDMCSMSSRMPLGGVYLDQATLQTMVDWICVGAPNN
jgi:hypothetical protein